MNNKITLFLLSILIGAAIQPAQAANPTFKQQVAKKVKKTRKFLLQHKPLVAASALALAGIAYKVYGSNATLDALGGDDKAKMVNQQTDDIQNEDANVIISNDENNVTPPSNIENSDLPSSGYGWKTFVTIGGIITVGTITVGIKYFDKFVTELFKYS